MTVEVDDPDSDTVNEAVLVPELPSVTVRSLILIVLGGGGALTVRVAVRVTPPAVAETTAERFVVAAVVLTVNAAVVAPSATVTLAGVVAAAVLLLVKATTVPPAGAAPLRVTVPVDELPPITVEGVRDRLVTVAGGGGAAGFTVKVADLVTEFAVAEMSAVCVAVTVDVEIANVTLDAPEGTIAVVGTAATPGFELVSDTAKPPLGAGLVRMMVPVEAEPPSTVDGVSETAERAAGGGGVVGAVMVSAVSADELLVPARMLTIWFTPVIALVLTVNVALVAPAGTVTLAGTVARVPLTKRLTTTPPDGAASCSVACPVEVLPPTTVAGLNVSDANAPTLGVPAGLTLIVCWRRTPPAEA